MNIELKIELVKFALEEAARVAEKNYRPGTAAAIRALHPREIVEAWTKTP